MQQQAAETNEEKQSAANAPAGSRDERGEANAAAGNKDERGEGSTSGDASPEAGRYLFVPSTDASR